MKLNWHKDKMFYPTKIVELIETAFIKAIPKYMSRYNATFLPINIEFSTKMACTAGYAYYKKRLIKLNVRLLSENLDHVVTTFIHELAHILTDDNYRGADAHGYYWCQMMLLLGQSPDRLHNMETEHLSTRQKFVALCRCDKHYVGKKVRDKIASGSPYTCRRCKAILVLEDKVDNNNNDLLSILK